MNYTRLLRRAFPVTLLLSGGIASGLIMFSVIALTGGLSAPGGSAAEQTASKQTAAKPTADKQVDQLAVEVDSPPDNNLGQAETQYAAVFEPGTHKAKKVQQAEPERAAEIVNKGAGSGSSTGAGDGNPSGSGSGGGAGSGDMGHGSSSAGGGFQLPGGGGFSVGGGSNQSPSGTRPAAPANPPQTGPVPVRPLAGPPLTLTPGDPPANPPSSPISLPLPGPAPVPPLVTNPLPPPGPDAPAVPIPTPEKILTAALDPKTGSGGGSDDGKKEDGKNDDGVLRPGHSPGTVHIPALTGLVGIEIEIGGPAGGQYDVVIVDGVASFPEDFKIAFILVGDYVPVSGADFEFLFADSLEGEQNINYSFLKPGSTILPNGFGYQVYVDGEADLHVRFFDANAPLQDYVHDLYTGAVVVPEPSTTTLGLLGLALLGWRMRRPVATRKY